MEYCDETLASRIQRPVRDQADNTEVFVQDDVSTALPQPGGKVEQNLRNTALSFVSDRPTSWGSNSASDLDWETVLKIIGDIVSGLIYIHAEGVVHRDLKPPNGKYPFPISVPKIRQSDQMKAVWSTKNRALRARSRPTKPQSNRPLRNQSIDRLDQMSELGNIINSSTKSNFFIVNLRFLSCRLIQHQPISKACISPGFHTLNCFYSICFQPVISTNDNLHLRFRDAQPRFSLDPIWSNA
jgi:hypothetical protein